MPTFNEVTAGSFCRELACGIEPLEDLLDSWGLTPEKYKELRKVPWFQREIIQAVADMKDMGPNSAFIMRCRGIAEDTLGDMLKIIQNDKNDASVRAAAFKQITDLARLAAPKVETALPQGPSVVFQFGGNIKGIPETLRIIPEQKQITSEQETSNG